MVNKEQGGREPSIVADPGLDPMSALRQTTEQAKAVTEGTVSTPAIEAVKNSKEAVGAELAAMPPMKYSRDGIPEGLDHVSEMERLRAMIQGGTASATDIDNYITLQTRAHNQAAQEFARSSEGNVVDMMGGPDETGTAPAGSAAGKAAREVPAAEEAPAPRSSMRSSGSVRGSGVDRGQPSSAGAQPRPSSRGPVGGSKQSVVNPSAEAPPVKGKYKEEPSGNFNRTRIPEGTPTPKATPSVSAPASFQPPKAKFTPLPNQQIAEAMGVPKAQRVKEYETVGGELIPLSDMGKAVSMVGPQFVSGVKGVGGAIYQAGDALLHPYGREGQDNRSLAAAKEKSTKVRKAKGAVAKKGSKKKST